MTVTGKQPVVTIAMPNNPCGWLRCVGQAKKLDGLLLRNSASIPALLTPSLMNNVCYAAGVTPWILFEGLAPGPYSVWCVGSAKAPGNVTIKVGEIVEFAVQ